MFIDRVHVQVQAGSGGNGCESYFRRTDKKTVPHGGDGGNGGSVIFRADADAPNLASFRARQRIIAESGGHGGSNRKRGRNGKDLIVPVPKGTKIWDRNRNFLIRELNVMNEEVIVVKGGKGGVGNSGGKQATPGEKGESLDLELNLTLSADVFLVGLPNSGKSTLLNLLTGSHAKEESYPFATRSPQMGVLSDPEHEPVTLCELPSLYESSHEGRGMGTGFLKHLEGANHILFVLDAVSSFSDSLHDGLAMLRRELELFQKEFLQISYAVAVNKIDLAEADFKKKKKDFDPGAPVFYISAVAGTGIEALKDYLRKM